VERELPIAFIKNVFIDVTRSSFCSDVSEDFAVLCTPTYLSIRFSNFFQAVRKGQPACFLQRSQRPTSLFLAALTLLIREKATKQKMFFNMCDILSADHAHNLQHGTKFEKTSFFSSY